MMLTRVIANFVPLAFWVALTAALALAGLWQWERAANARLEADNAALARSLAAEQEARAQAREAARVADAHRQREAERAARLDASIETILTGDLTNADLVLDPRIGALLECLRTGNANACAGGAERLADPVLDF